MAAALAAVSFTLPAQAATAARNLPGVSLIWATQTAMRLGWSPSATAQYCSYQLVQMNGKKVRSGSGQDLCHMVTSTGLHPGWRYRFTIWAYQADGRSQRATLSVLLPTPVPLRERAYQWAETQAGARYVYGAEGHGSYDCSGLVRTAYQHAGIWLPRTTGQMLQDSRLHRVSSPRQGDLVFFGAGHVELYDRQDWSFGAESGPETQHGGSWWYQWWPGNWWPSTFYRVQGAG
ncbi:MAG TPA: NlpC/P60 family protein [Streptosporangiaceae bacterium]